MINVMFTTIHCAVEQIYILIHVADAIDKNIFTTYMDEALLVLNDHRTVEKYHGYLAQT